MAIILKREPLLSAKHSAFPYQREAVESIRDLEYSAIFHEQGLGKSKIALDLILYWLTNKTVDTVLLVAKKGLVDNWKREFAAHSHIRPLVLGSDHARNFYVFNTGTRVLLTHYEAIKTEFKRLKLYLATRRVAIILDEATKIKNPDSALSQCFFSLSPSFVRRVIMTGTPVANRPFDIWGPIFFLDQGRSLGTDFELFRKSLDISNDLADDLCRRNEFELGVADIFHRIARFSVRETKRSGIIELPSKIYQSIMTDWEPRQLDLYNQYRDSLSAVIKVDGTLKNDEAEAILKRMLRLVQIASNPKLVDEAYSGEPGKFPSLYDLVTDICREGEKCIVWTLFTENADWLADRLRGFGTCKIHGKLSMEQRNRAVTLFLQDPECRVLVATPGAAKEGLTLTVANHVIFYDRGFSLDDYLQAQDRIHRVSQTRQCYVYNFLLSDSIDEWVDSLLRAKELAAHLAQGDITLEEYRSQADYSFSDIIRGILSPAASIQGGNQNA